MEFHKDKNIIQKMQHKLDLIIHMYTILLIYITYLYQRFLKEDKDSLILRLDYKKLPKKECLMIKELNLFMRELEGKIM